MPVLKDRYAELKAEMAKAEKEQAMQPKPETDISDMEYEKRLKDGNWWDRWKLSRHETGKHPMKPNRLQKKDDERRIELLNEYESWLGEIYQYQRHPGSYDDFPYDGLGCYRKAMKRSHKWFLTLSEETQLKRLLEWERLPDRAKKDVLEHNGIKIKRRGKIAELNKQDKRLLRLKPCSSVFEGYSSPPMTGEDEEPEIF